MLNSQEIAQLKIQGLINRQKIQNSYHHYQDLTRIFMTPSQNTHHFFIKDTPNSNFIGFSYILLSHICDNKRDSSDVEEQQKQQLIQPLNQDNSGRGQINEDRKKVKYQERGKEKSSERRAQKIFHLLLSQQLDFSKIINLPQNISKILFQIQVQVNLYLKKLLLEFLSIIQNKCQEKNKFLYSKNQNPIKGLTILSMIQTYPVSQVLLTIFMRSILYFQYQIYQAADFTTPISDHTVYAALCDAFNFTSLRMEQNYTQIQPSYQIRSLKILDKNKNIQNTYLVSIPENKEVKKSNKQFLGDTFRLQRKSDEQASNNQSLSFRQSSRNLHNQQQQIKQQDKDYQKSQFIQAALSYQNKISKFSQVNSLLRSNIRESIQPNLPTPPTHYLSQKQHKNSISRELELQNSLGQQYSSEMQRQLDGYTSSQILKQLHPSVRQKIETKISQYRKIRYS